MTPPLTPIDGEKLEDIIGLCLSGGGYRAMLFHTGVIVRLNELGLLSRIARISSVSGGSMTAAALATAWPALQWEEGRATNLDAQFLPSVMAQANDGVDLEAGIDWLLPFVSPQAGVEASFARHLTQGRALADLPAFPVFTFNATNLMTGGLMRMRRDYIADWKIGRFQGVELPLARAVAASAGFPPLLSPVEIDLSSGTLMPDRETPLYTAPELTRRALLTDGGVHDNLGTETVWKRCRTVLVSDAGRPFQPQPDPHRSALQMMRVLQLALNQAESLRERILRHAYEIKARHGAFWSLTSDIPAGLTDAEYRAAQAVPTRLERFPQATQALLLKAGYLHAAAQIAADFGPEVGGYAARPATGWPEA